MSLRIFSKFNVTNEYESKTTNKQIPNNPNELLSNSIILK